MDMIKDIIKKQGGERGKRPKKKNINNNIKQLLL